MESDSDYSQALMLIIDEFDGIISEEDLQKLNNWRRISPENERIYQEFRSVNSEVEALSNFKQLNVNDTWVKLDARLGTAFKTIHPTPGTSNSGRTLTFWLSAAASLLVLIGLYFYQQYDSVRTIATATGTYLRLTLPDNSFVALNENSEIRYNSDQFTKQRTIELIKGEAYFNVKHNSAQPFKIIAGDAEIEDLGTSFDVIRTKNSVKVLVTSGKVSLKATENGSSRLILPGHAVHLNTDSHKFSDLSSGLVRLGWCRQSLSFNNADLSEIATKLSNVYNMPIELKKRYLKSRKLTANLSYQTVDSALAVVGATLQLHINKSEGKYTITD